MREIKTISIKEYLIKKGILFIERNGKLISKCIFNNCDSDSRGNEVHPYLNATACQYEFKKYGGDKIFFK